jgi:hypothetical protein
MADHREAFQFRCTAATPLDCFDKAAVAELSDQQIAQMSGDELIEALRHAQLPFFSTKLRESLQTRDHHSLRRLVFEARRMCRVRGY